MFKKKNQANKVLKPGEVYQSYRQQGGRNWHKDQLLFKKKKRKRRISRIMRRGQHPKRTLRPVL